MLRESRRGSNTSIVGVGVGIGIGVRVRGVVRAGSGGLIVKNAKSDLNYEWSPENEFSHAPQGLEGVHQFDTLRSVTPQH